MILVEADVSGEWDQRSDWPSLADSAVRAAVRASRHHALVDAPLAAEISVKFTSDDQVRALNAAYRGKDKPTNVLSFPMFEPESLDGLLAAKAGEILLGDVAVAHGVCAAQASAEHKTLQAHASHLVVHGVLHLLGYDHETGDSDAEAMEMVERRALASLGVADPYAMTEVQS